MERGRTAGAEEDLRVSEEKHLIEEATYLISCHNKPRGFFFFFKYVSGSYAVAVTRQHFHPSGLHRWENSIPIILHTWRSGGTLDS